MLTVKISQHGDPDAGLGHLSPSRLWQGFHSKGTFILDNVVYACNFSPREAKTGGLWEIGNQPGLYGEFQANRGHKVRHCLRTNEKGWCAAQSVECPLAGPRSWL